MNIIKRINRLKNEKDAIILAHLYQPAEIQDIADFVGDSLELARKAADTNASVIVFCGVLFMAESAKILNPDKTVLLPVVDAGCPMADMVTADDIKRHRNNHPDAAVVCYVNSSAEAKAESDICCTSSNATKIVKSLIEDKIIFVPDRNLGSFVADKLPRKEIILHEGWCIVHKQVQTEEIDKAKKAHPNALVLAHPECTPEVIKKADFAGSTAQIIDFVKKSDNKQFIISTEMGILHLLKRQNPEKEFFMASEKLLCVDMKKTSLSDILKSLENMQHEIILDKHLIERSQKSLDRMLDIK